MIVKINIFDVFAVPNNKKEEITKKALEYKLVEVIKDNSAYEKPEFNYDELNSYIDDYLNFNVCTDLEYDVYELSDGVVSIYLNCGTPQNIIYDYHNKKELPFSSLTKNMDTFTEKVIYLLKLKYPKFIVDEINIQNGIFHIKSNEIIAFYETESFGRAQIKINNNEIKDLMKYDMLYDETYENEIYTLDKNKKAIAFTFDDGPSNYDKEIIDILVDGHAKATFFMVGNRVNNFSSSILKMVENDMELGNHTYDHKSLTGLSDANILKEINDTNALIKNISGQDVKLFRPSFGATNRRVSLASGMPSILWSVDTLDWKTRNADKVLEHILNDSEDGSIVLMHSLYPSTVEAVRRSLPELYKRGFQVVSVGELFELKNKEIEIGKSYRYVKSN